MLDYIVFNQNILFSSFDHNQETARKERMGFAFDDHPDFHVALYLAKKEPDIREPDRRLVNRVITALLGADSQPIHFMKLPDFVHLFLLTVRPVEAMSERLKGKDPAVTLLKLPQAEILKRYQVAFRIIE